MHRRGFIALGTRAAGLLAVGQTGTLLTACQKLDAVSSLPSGSEPLHRPATVSPDGLTLVARETFLSSRGVQSPIWTFGEGPVGPTLEARRGDRARILLRNELPEPTIVHWHGFRPPEAADGHPRFAVQPGESYHYDFVIDEPAGLYWYHPHPHHRTAIQTYYGMAGLILVRDEVEDRLGLPSGEREIALIVQDRQLDAEGRILYAPRGHDLMEGYLGAVPFVNGIRSPVEEVAADLYRLRIVNGSNARILRLALSTGDPLVVVGGDAGLLPEPVELPYVDFGTAERVDVLVDFSRLSTGSRVTLKSLPFQAGGMMGGMGMGRGGMGGMRGMGGMGLAQGAEMDLVEFVVAGTAARPPRNNFSPPSFDRLAPQSASRRRTFRFESAMMRHGINGRGFELENVDEHVPLGATEIWEFVNDSPFPHSVHVHATHFQLLSRTGGRADILPWERGGKDTVLVMPEERVEVIARFDRHPGIFLIHCHNLEHEDMDMMLNFRVG